MMSQPNGSQSSIKTSIKNNATWDVSFLMTIEYTIVNKSGDFVKGGSYNEDVSLSAGESIIFTYDVPDKINQQYKIVRGRINNITPGEYNGNTVKADIIDAF